MSQGDVNGNPLSSEFYFKKDVFGDFFVELNKIAKINPNRKKPTFGDDDLVPYVGLPETDDGEIKIVNLRPYKEVKGRNIIKKGDILFARIEPSIFNKKYIYVNDLKGHEFVFTSTEFYILESNEKAKQKYLYYQLFTDKVYNQFSGKTTGSTGRRRLDRQVFEQVQIPLPSLDIQQQIVDKMDNALAEKQKLESESKETLESIDEYVLGELGIKLPEQKEKKMCFSVNFGEIKNNRFDVEFFNPEYKYIQDLSFEMKEISKVAKFIPGYAFSSRDYKKSGIKLCTIKNIKPYGIDFSDVTFLPLEFLEKYEKFKILNGDLVFAMTGATIGKIMLFESDEDVLLNQRVGIIRANKGINNNYLFYFLNTKLFKQQIIKNSVGGAQANISETSIMNIQVPFPPIEIQNKIAYEVNNKIKEAKDKGQQAKEIYEKAKKEVEEMVLN